MSEQKKGIQSIESGFNIIKEVSRSDQPLTITELSNLCGMPKSQLYRYLISLCRIGFLEKGEDLRYSLGNELAAIGLHALKKIDIQAKALPYIKRLNETLDETVALAIWINREGPTFVSWEESKKAININVRIGSIVPLTNNATGNIFAAFYPRSKTEDLIKKELEKKYVDEDTFNMLINKARKNGYATTIKYLPGISAISVPVFDQQQNLVAAITVVGLTGSMDISEDSKLTKELLKTADELSRDIGYSDANIK